MLHLLVKIDVRPDRLPDWHELARAHAAASAAERGCAAFEVLGGGLSYVLREVWRDERALEAHRLTPHYARWRSLVAGIEAAPRTHERYAGPAKVVPAALLPAIAAAARARGRTVAFANGCWDLLHPGHVACLAEAREQADVLVAAVNSDGSVAALKGAGRPVLPLADRVALLSALAAVDYVVRFDAPTPLELVRALRPDVLVKGAEYEGRAVAGAEYAGRVHLAAMRGDHSTTRLVGLLEKSMGGIR